jgi:Ca2+-transporting ATPase
MKAIHQQTAAAALKLLKSSTKGLSPTEVQKRLEEHGKNTLPEKKKSRLKMFVVQFQSPLIYILFVAVILAIAIPYLEEGYLSAEHMIDPIAIFSIIILNALFGFFQEMKAENTLQALKHMQPDLATVVRGGEKMQIQAEELVPGDILALGEGDKIPADARLIEAVELRVIEAALTGESSATQKDAAWHGEGGVADRKNMVFSGTQIASGRLTAVVTSTGLGTELGKIATLVSETDSPPTPLEKRLDKLGKKIGGFVVVICFLIFLLSLMQGVELHQALLTAVALAVAAVPEGLPAVMTISLAVGVAVMAKKNALIRELRAVETLGSVTTIASDKTGTITKNKMHVVSVFCEDAHFEEKDFAKFAKLDSAKTMLDVAAGCNDAELPSLGDPTEIALLEIADEYDFSKRERIDEVPFSSEKKWMSTTHQVDGTAIEYIKGAPEAVEQFCDKKVHKKMQDATIAMAKEGLRTIAIATRKQGVKQAEFQGIFGLLDPPRKTAQIAIKKAKRAGVRTVMITGDHAITAATIAKKVGLSGEAITGNEIEKMDEKQLQAVVKTTNVFARVSPEHKVRICTALQANGNIVAMTGDGVNDAPAIHRAEVGVSMGVVGTSVARQASDMVLLDDRFATIVNGIEEGRRIFTNIKKSIAFLLRTNFCEVLLIVAAVLLATDMPLLPIHILFLNLLTDSFPALAMAAEPAEEDIMGQPPRPINQGFLHGQFVSVFVIGSIGAVISLAIFLLAKANLDLAQAQTLTLTTMVFIELIIVFSIRREAPLWSKHKNIFENIWILRAVLLALAIYAVMLFTPAGTIMKLELFPLHYWLWAAGGAILTLFFAELLKLRHEKM